MELLHLVSYDKKTGAITPNSADMPKERVRYFKSSNKHYKSIFVNKVDYLSHRLAFLMVNGRLPDTIDHINGDGTDNRWENLREITRSENSLNKKIYSCNSTGAAGVTRRNGKFRARIRFKGVLYNIGTYNSIEEAAKARREKEEYFGFHENHGKRKDSY